MNIPTVHNRVRGEYRAVLRDFKGRIKHDSGWRPNMVLDQGPWLWLQNLNAANVMAVGDSDAAVVSTQTGIQGTMLGYASRVWYGGWVVNNFTTLPYWIYCQQPYLFGLGIGTGLIKEFSLFGGNTQTQAQNDSVVRVVLDTPINKTSTDQLTIEWRLYMYFQEEILTGTLDCSGVSYDWELGWYDIDQLMYGQAAPAGIISQFSYGPTATSCHPDGVMPVNILSQPTIGTSIGGFGSVTDVITNGSPPYRTITLSSNVDQTNGIFNLIKCRHNRGSYGTYSNSGRCIRIARSSDGNPFVKADTHEITFQYRLFLDKYTP